MSTASLAALFSKIAFTSLTPNDLPSVYALLPKNSAGLIDLKILLAISRALILARGATWDVEAKLNALETIQAHEDYIENGFPLAAFQLTVEKDLLATAESNQALLSKKAAEKAAEELKAEEAAEEEARQQEAEAKEKEEKAAAKAALAAKQAKERDEARAAALAATTSLSSVASNLTVTTTITPPPKETATIVTPSTPRSAALTQSGPTTPRSPSIVSSLPSSSLVESHLAQRRDAAQLAELEAAYERTKKDLEKARGQLRQQATQLFEFEAFRRDTERKEELHHDAIADLQIRLTRERNKTKQISSTYETRIAELTQSANAFTSLQSDYERLTMDYRKVQLEVNKTQQLHLDLAEANNERNKLEEAQRTQARQTDLLKKKLQNYDQLLAEHGALQAAHETQSVEAAQLAQHFQQLSEAYESEEQLYRDAQSRIQSLEQELVVYRQEHKLDGKRAAATAAAASSVDGSSDAATPSKKHERHASLLDDILDSASVASDSSAPSDDMPMPPPPISSREHSANTPQSSNSLTPPTSHSPMRQPPASPAYAHLIPAHSKITFQPDANDASRINFQFFQLILLSVASHLSCCDYPTLTTQTIPLTQLYQEAMEQRIHVNKYSHWIDQRLRAIYTPTNAEH